MAGRSPVLNQSKGSIITGVVAAKVVMIPASPFDNPNNKSVIPKPIPIKPQHAILATKPIELLLTRQVIM